MAKRIGTLQGLVGGISRSKKTGPANSFYFGTGIDFRRDSSEVTIHPLSANISGSTVTDLPMWMEVAGDLLYAYGNAGNVYLINTSDTITNEYTIPSSVGNGMGYLAEDRYLYLASNTSLSRRSTANTSTGTYYPNFLENEGGAPTNTKSILFAAASSMSATRADTASLSITSDITLEAFVKPVSMPTGSNTMALISKWDESGTKQSYKMSFIATSNAFGSGSDGAVTISSNTTQAPTDSACTGTIATTTLSATNASFAAGQKILIHQSRGTGAGTYMINGISAYTAGTITLDSPLNATYTSGAQVIVMPQYTNVTVNAGITWTAKAWTGTVGGILCFLATGTVTINGTISATGRGFAGGTGDAGGSANSAKASGEGTAGASASQSTANGNGGGGGINPSQGVNDGVGGSGGGHASAGTNGQRPAWGRQNPGTSYGGDVAGSADLTTLVFGGGGGAGGSVYWTSPTATGGSGGTGGGIVFFNGVTVTNSGSIVASGSAGSNGVMGGSAATSGGGGGGAGGAVFIGAQTATLGTSAITVAGGSGGSTANPNGAGGAGSIGRININYYTSYTGTSSPTINNVQDDTLGAANGYALRFYVSSTGNNSDTYTMPIDNPTGQWNRFSVAWDASDSRAYFYQNGDLLGSRVGTLTAIHDNASIFGLATFVSSGSANTAFYDGYMDDVRVWNDLRTASEISNYNRQVLTGSEGGLVAYYKLDNGVTDSQTSGLNNLTANNSPTYSTDIPFFGVTTRSDEDVSISGSGQTYTLTTAINEGATHRQTFTPTKEPLKSVALTIAAVGTGNWTVVIHDELNRTLASVTVANADLVAGVYEFIFSSSVRPVLNASYHLHVYSSVADGTVSTSVASDLEGAYLKTYFQILVSDTYHPIKQFTNFLLIGNERYVAKLEAGSVYNPHRLTLPSGYRVRCFGFWHDYVAIGTWHGSAITDTDSAKIFLWDGTSDTYVEPIDIPQGAINAMFGKQGRLLISAGYRGQFFEYTGGAEAVPLFRLPLTEKSDEVEIAPGAMGMWQGLVTIGAALSTDSSTLHQGVYTWGHDEAEDPMSLGFDYPLSIGDTTSSNAMVTSVMPRGKKLYVGYGNSGAYGIDVVDQSANPYATATIELLIVDLQSVQDIKYPLAFRCDFLPLVSGQSVTLKYKADRETSWHTLQTQDTAGADAVAGSLLKVVKEVQFAVDIVTNGSQITITNFSFDMETDGSRAMRNVK